MSYATKVHCHQHSQKISLDKVPQQILSVCCLPISGHSCQEKVPQLFPSHSCLEKVPQLSL